MQFTPYSFAHEPRKKHHKHVASPTLSSPFHGHPDVSSVLLSPARSLLGISRWTQITAQILPSSSQPISKEGGTDPK